MIVPASPENVARAAAAVRTGGVVAFPTETVYGLGADATNAGAVARLFAIKGRPAFDPIIVHVARAADGNELVRGVPDAAAALMERFWPGPLTVVLPKTARVPDIVTAGLPAVGVRVPRHPVALALIAASGVPIAAPSANRFGRVSPTTAAHVAEQLGAAVPLILDGGPCAVGLESTIIAFTGRRPALLRAGGIPLEAIEALIGRVEAAGDAPRPLAPGQLTRHYAPTTPLTLVAAAEAVPVGARAEAALLLVVPPPGAPVPPSGFRHIEVLAPDGDLCTAAANLFAALRRLERGPYRHIYAVEISPTGLGRAIVDRLRRAQAASA
jgi:L-threonylcarbamoyladenylate synthase